MTLHEAIFKVLTIKKRAMKAADIAYEINNRKLYRRKDGGPVPTSQIHARVKNYPGLFFKRDGFIGLVRWNNQPDIRNESTNSHLTEIGPQISEDVYEFKGDITRIPFLTRNDFQPIGNIRELFRTGLPPKPELAECGLYAITIPEGYKPDFIGPDEAKKDGNVIRPWPISRLKDNWVPGTDIVYFGLAGARSNRSLRKRLRDLLRHGSGHTTNRGPHKGGEILWQLAGYGNFTIWILPTPGPPVPRELEHKLLKEFERKTGQLPFANRQL